MALALSGSELALAVLVLIVIPLGMIAYCTMPLYLALRRRRTVPTLGRRGELARLRKLLVRLERNILSSEIDQAKKTIDDVRDLDAFAESRAVAEIDGRSPYLRIYLQNLADNVFWKTNALEFWRTATTGLNRDLVDRRAGYSKMALEGMAGVIRRSRESLRTRKKLALYEVLCNLSIYERVLRGRAQLVDVSKQELVLIPADREFLEDLREVADAISHRSDIESEARRHEFLEKWWYDKPRSDTLSAETYFVLRMMARLVFRVRNMETVSANASVEIRASVERTLAVILSGLASGDRRLILDCFAARLRQETSAIVEAKARSQALVDDSYAEFTRAS